MPTVQFTIIKPSKDISFFNDPLFKEHVKKNYILTKKIRIETVLSEDTNVLSMKINFLSEEYKNEYMEDSLVHQNRAKQVEYNKKNNISVIVDYS